MISRDRNTINFINKFINIKKKTKNFTKINSKILQEDTQNLTIFRVIFGLTTNQFAKKLELPYSWVYHLEHSKKNIKKHTAKKYSLKIYKLLKEYNLTGNVNLENTILNSYSLKGIIKETKISNFLKDLEDKNFKEFLELVEYLKDITNNFSNFPSSLVLEDSKIILVIRILLGKSQKEFAKETNMANMTLEELENSYRKIRWPTTAKIYADKIEKLIGQYKIPLDKLLIKKRWERWKNTRKIKEKDILGWKTIRNMGVEDFREYFNFIKNKTNNFNNINPILLQKSPQAITIFRILLNLTQRDLERVLKLKGRVISNYESKVYTTLSKGRSELFTDLFTKEFKTQKLSGITTEEAIQKFITVKESMYTHKNSSSQLLKKWTVQEKEIFKEINNLKTKRLIIKPHNGIEIGNNTINVDFLICYKNNPIIVIEATTFYHTKSKKFSYNFKRKIFDTDYRFVKLKKKYPHIATFLIIKTDKDEIVEKRIERFVENETIAINKTFINHCKDTLKKAILEVK